MKKGLAVVVIALLLGATVFEDMHRRITKNLIGYGSTDADPAILPSSEHEQIRMRAMALHSYALEKSSIRILFCYRYGNCLRQISLFCI